MITDVWVNFNYGGWTISFKKTFDLPFTPFYGLVLNDTKGVHENDIHFETHDYCRTRIDYSIEEERFNVDVRHVWKHPVTDEAIDSEIETFTNTGWERKDRTNIDDLKTLMKREHNNRN